MQDSRVRPFCARCPQDSGALPSTPQRPHDLGARPSTPRPCKTRGLSLPARIVRKTWRLGPLSEISFLASLPLLHPVSPPLLRSLCDCLSAARHKAVAAVVAATVSPPLPHFSGNWRQAAHTADVQPTTAQKNPLPPIGERGFFVFVIRGPLLAETRPEVTEFNY